MKSAALFDLDGVIVDTEPSYTDFWEMIGRDYLPSIDDFAFRIKGHTLGYIFDHYFPSDSHLREQIKVRLDEHQRTMHYPFVPGIMDFVSLLRAKGVGTAVVTSSDLIKMNSLYKEHPSFAASFDRIFTAEDSLRSKPAPDCYLAAARYFGLPASSCVVFEDSFNGLVSGRDSGAQVVGLTTSNSKAAIEKYCDRVVADFRECEEILSLFEMDS